jgi:hypothetical protein
MLMLNQLLSLPADDSRTDRAQVRGPLKGAPKGPLTTALSD